VQALKLWLEVNGFLLILMPYGWGVKNPGTNFKICTLINYDMRLFSIPENGLKSRIFHNRRSATCGICAQIKLSVKQDFGG
jgi:hypothetical protein